MNRPGIYLTTCRCGGQPEFKSCSENGCHGCTNTYHWVECKCGMATVRVLEWEGGKPVVMAKCAKIWNGAEDKI